MGLLDGKVVIVTGGGGGIGRAEALRLAEAGAKVVVNDIGCAPDGTGRDPSVADAAVRAIEANGGEALASHDDVSSAEAVDRMMRAAIARFGAVDALVTNAAVFADAPIVELDMALFDHVMNTTLRGVVHCVAAVARHLVERKAPGRILTTSSLAGLRGSPGLPLYSAAKAGVYGLTITVAQELEPHGITVNTLSPIAYTRVTAGPMAHVPNASELLSPTFVADVVAFLLSDLAAGITGTVVEVQGQQVSVSRMLQTAGALPASGTRWTPEELARRWPEIQSLTQRGTVEAVRSGGTS
jgi:NAD(P)-dependent dehydrogenase (short-subunit alcohol dehydrogenase family)